MRSQVLDRGRQSPWQNLQIRCKKCSNVIIVREKEGGEADGGAGEANDPAGDEGGWHLAIDGETVGPVPEQEVRDRFAAGEIDKDTSIWQEGFEDWLPLGEVETFADLVASSASSGFGAVAGAGAAVAAAAAADPFADGEAMTMGPLLRARARSRCP